MPPNWHVDPVSGLEWPRDPYCFDVMHRHADGVRGSVRYAWEINRLQFLQPMAALAAADNDRELAATVSRHVFSWIDDNPPYRGINWISGIELALRAVSLLIVDSLIGDMVFDSGQRRRLAQCLAAHGYWLDRFPSAHSSANNHVVAEAGGLYLLGLLAPDMAMAQRWARTGRAMLLREVERQFHDDGVGAEQSPTYGGMSLEWFLLCGLMGGHYGDPWPEDYWIRLEAAGDALRAITDAGGHHPRIGDDDEGSVFWLSHPGQSVVTGMLSALAAVRDRADLAPPVPVPLLSHAIYGAPPQPVPAPRGFRCFRSGGYSVSRYDDEDEECLVLFDHGPLGYLSIAAHGHADALSVWLHAGGRPLIIDAGTYRYSNTTADDWRGHFRSTVAHNTLSIEGGDSSIIAGSFNWSRKANTTLLDVQQDGETWSVEAEHDGYVDDYGYRHRRRVERLGPALYQIVDQLIGDGAPERVEIGFLMAPDLEVSSAAGGWVVSENGRRRLYLRHEGPLKGWVERGLEAPKRGWCSPAYGELTPASRLVFAGKMWDGAVAKFTLTTKFD